MIIKTFKHITIAILGLSLVACNSDETTSLVDVTTPPVTTLVDVTTPPVIALLNIPQQLKATATYDDGSSVELTDSNVTWEVLNAASGDVELTATGKMTVKDSSASGVTVKATVNGISSDESPVSISTLDGAVIDSSGKLFTSSPSKVYLDNIGGSASDGTYTESGARGSAGEYYAFNWNNANTLCSTYNAKSLGGRTNWRLAEKDELKIELFGKFGNMFNARGWPATYDYWSAAAIGSDYFSVNLLVGDVTSGDASDTIYASCVSNP